MFRARHILPGSGSSEAPLRNTEARGRISAAAPIVPLRLAAGCEQGRHQAVSGLHPHPHGRRFGQGGGYEGGSQKSICLLQRPQALAVAGLSIVGEGFVGLRSFRRAALSKMLLCPFCPYEAGITTGCSRSEESLGPLCSPDCCAASCFGARVSSFFCVDLAAGTSGN